jgi:hypothetical protein
MKNLFRAAHADVATQLSTDNDTRFDASVVKRLMGAMLMTATLVGATAAHADNGTMFGQIFGAAIGAAVGAKATQHVQDNVVKYGLITAVGAVGSYAGGEMGKRIDGSPDQRQGQQQQQVSRPMQQTNYETRNDQGYQQQGYQQQGYPQQAYPQPPARNDSRSAQEGWQYRGQSQDGPTVFSGDAAGMPKIVSASLARANTGLIASGSGSLSNDPVASARLAKVTDRLVAGAQSYGSRIDAWDDAATLTGIEGGAARTKAADGLAVARRDLDANVKDWAQVRNVLAQRGYDVSQVDKVVKDRLVSVDEPNRYVYNGSQASMRP